MHAQGAASSSERDAERRFSREIMPHLDAAYTLARWLVRNDQDAEDIVQEALLKAFRFFDGFKGENPRAWIISIVRNTSYSWLEARRPMKSVPVDDVESEPYGAHRAAAVLVTTEDPESLLMRRMEQRRVNDAIAALPLEYREVIVLRELEELSYKEISDVTKLPLGTVMSRLSRARQRLRKVLRAGLVQGAGYAEIDG